MYQPGILPDQPEHARYIEFILDADCDAGKLRALLEGLEIDETLVVGLGRKPLALLGADPAAIPAFPAFDDGRYSVPETQADLWVWLRSSSRGDIAIASHRLVQALSPVFEPTRQVDGFKFGGRDLTGYEDGTENPKEQDAVEAAFANEDPLLPAGGSYVAVQQWKHDLFGFNKLAEDVRNNIIGRRLSDNEELEDAPDFAHVKRTAQESFTPEAFMLRRSMPWSDNFGEGLYFVAFGKSVYAFEVQMNRMVGKDDGIVDGLMDYSVPITGAYYWCPPISDGKLVLP